MSYKVPKKLYDLEEFNYVITHMQENIKEILREYLTYYETEYNLLVSHVMGYGMTPFQMVEISENFYFELFKLTNDNEYSEWTSKLSKNIHIKINQEVENLQSNNEIVNFTKLGLVDHLMIIVKNNFNVNELNYLIKN